MTTESQKTEPHESAPCAPEDSLKTAQARLVNAQADAVETTTCKCERSEPSHHHGHGCPLWRPEAVAAAERLSE